MDGAGGEALLVRRSKAKKRTPAPERDAAADRLRLLWREYGDLLEETEAKKKMLASANRRKRRLLAEVKFLQRKYKSFFKSDPQQKRYKLKKQARRIPSSAGNNEASAFPEHGQGTEVPSSSKNTCLDLNQDTVMNDEGNDCQGHQGHPKLDKFDQDGDDEDTVTTDVKLSVCRDTGNAPASGGKRTVPWQDRLAV